MLFEQNNPLVSIPASEMLVKSAGFDVVNGKLCFIFSTSEGKRGYGKQAIPVSDLEECYQTLKTLADQGVKADNYVPTTPEVIQQSLILSSEDGSVRFKSQPDKGKKPTYFHSESDFQGFVAKFGELLPMIQERGNSLIGNSNDNVSENSSEDID
tara:strand:- start:96 stop:560 length:465 start_codon:yes stop_codon:yes gene_type:complete